MKAIHTMTHLPQELQRKIEMLRTVPSYKVIVQHTNKWSGVSIHNTGSAWAVFRHSDSEEYRKVKLDFIEGLIDKALYESGLLPNHYIQK